MTYPPPDLPDHQHTVIIVGRGRSAASFQGCYTRALTAGGIISVYTLNHHREPAATLHFEIHSPRHHATSDLGIPVCIHEDETPAAAGEFRYPRASIHQLFGLTPADDMLGCTIARMIAYALYARATHLMLPGCDRYDPCVHLYRQALRCCEAWLFFAKARGVDVWLPPGSQLLSTEDYR